MKNALILTICLFFAIYSHAAESSTTESSQAANQKFDLSADDVSVVGDIVTAQGNAFLIYGDIYMVASKIIYDKNAKIAYLKDNAKIYYNNNLYVDMQEVSIKLSDKSTIINNLYLQSNVGVWVMADSASSENEVYRIKKAVISGCDIVSPLWHLNASSGIYDTKNEFISVWNARFYLSRFPVLYLPYFSASTSNKRKSGLLLSEFSLTNKQGFVLLQPLFIAPFKQWDITLTPQIRTKRGYGGELEFAFADSNNSIAKFTTRYFNTLDSYIQAYNLKNKEIFGFNFDYSTNVFSTKSSQIQDGIFFDINYMNDLEYMRLRSINSNFNVRLYESRINYFANSQNHYFGTYLKYYLDLSKPNNNSVFQTLPHIHYHHYTDSLFIDNLLYSIDLQSKNITRIDGYTYHQHTLSMPIGTQVALFKNHIITQGNIELYGTALSLNETQNLLDSATNQKLDRQHSYLQGNYNLSLNTDLARPYKKFFHSIHAESMLSGAFWHNSSPGLSDERFSTYNALLQQGYSAEQLAAYWNPNDIVNVTKNKHKLDLKLSQYFYGNSGNELFFLRLSRRLFLDDELLNRSQNLRGEIGFSPFNGLNLTATTFYSSSKKEFNEYSINANFNRWGINSTATYYFKLDPLYLSSPQYSSQNIGFARGTLGYDFRYFTLNANIGYDVGIGYVKDWYVVLSKDIRCFGVGLKFAHDIRPILQQDNAILPVVNQYVKIEFRFVPFPGTGVTYRMKE